MLSTDELFLVLSRLREDAVLREDVRQALLHLADSSSYRAWHGSLAQARPHEVTQPHLSAPLHRSGLLVGSRLAVRANVHAGLVFATDGVWVPPAYRVFPFNDESQALLELVHERGLADRAELVVDIAGGCGHTAWALDAPVRVNLDVNSRALVYAEFNRVLNNLPGPDCTCMLNDIQQGLPNALPAARQTLLLGNLPFGLSLTDKSLSLTSDGGADGLRLQRAALQALGKWLVTRAPGAEVTLLLLGLSLGDASDGKWQLQRTAEALYGQHQVSWSVLHREHLARANAQRVLPNPATVLQALPELAACQLYFPEQADGGRALEVAREAAIRLTREGTPDLAYGALQVQVPVPRTSRSLGWAL